MKDNNFTFFVLFMIMAPVVVFATIMCKFFYQEYRMKKMNKKHTVIKNVYFIK